MEEEEEEEEEDEVFLKRVCVGVSCIPTRSPRQIDANSFRPSFKRRHETKNLFLKWKLRHESTHCYQIAIVRRMVLFRLWGTPLKPT